MTDFISHYQSPPGFQGFSASPGLESENDQREPTTNIQNTCAGSAFVFPARATASFSGDENNSREQALSSTTGVYRRPLPLPAFSFPPSATASPSDHINQTTATTQYNATPTRSGRHRRTPSELVGGDERLGVPGLRSVSPTKNQELGLASSLSPSLPVTPIRGHRHRRSAALSVQELDKIMKPRTLSKSALSIENLAYNFTSSCESTQEGDWCPASTASSPGYSQNFDGRVSGLRSQRPLKSPGRIRVGFSDKTEIIPRRPLSTISSETEGSISTIKRLSMAESISSITSGINEPVKTLRSPLATTFEDGTTQARPHSAGASPRIDGGNNESSDDDLFTSAKAPSHNLRKFPSWNSLKLSRKSKVQESLQPLSKPITIMTQNVSIPPSPLRMAITDAELNQNFDDDPTSAVVTEFPAFIFPSTCPADSSSRVHNWMDNESKENDNPMIDLDIALDMSDKARHGCQFTSFSSSRTNVQNHHRLSGLLNSGSKYHRRTESAPQLAVMGAERPLLRRLNSNSASEERGRFEMENVFEEDESELLGLTAQEASTDADPAMVNQETQLAEPQPTAISYPASQSGLEKSYDLPRQTLDASPLMFAADDVLVVGEDNGPSDVVYITSSNSTITSLDNESLGTKGKSIVPMLSSQPSTSATHITFCESGPSSESGCSISGMHNTRAVYKKASSTDGLRGNSATVDGYKHDGRQSVDDVPSLISSGSTMTSYLRQASMSSPSLAAAAPSIGSAPSVKSEAQQRRRNRASMASLSRLMGNSFGAKSALSVNTVADYSNPPSGPKKEKKRSSRLGRLFRFWQPKQADTA